MRGSIIVSSLLAILFIAIGWTLGQVLEDIAPFTLDWAISIPDVLTIIVELFLACYIARLIEKGVQDQRVEKDFFIQELSTTQDSLIELERSCSRTTSLSLNLTIYEVEKIKRNLIRIWKIMATRNKSFHDKNNSDYQKLLASIKILNTQLTDSSYFNSINGISPIKIVRGVIHLNHTVIPEISKSFTSIKDSIFSWKIRINDM